MARGQFNIWIPSTSDWGKFDWVPTTTWESSDAADDVLVRLGLTNGRGIRNIYNKFVKPVIVDKFTQIWNIAGGYMQALSGGVLPVGSFSAVLGNGFTNLLKTQGIDSVKSNGLYIYVSPEDIQQIENAIKPIRSNKNSDHSILMKRLHEGMIYRLEQLKSMEFESSVGKSALIHVLAIQTIINRDIFNGTESTFFDASNGVSICASEDYQKMVYGLINPKFNRKQVSDICNFLAAFRYTDNQAEYDEFKRKIDQFKDNAIVAASTNNGMDTKLIVGIASAIGGFLLLKGGK